MLLLLVVVRSQNRPTPPAPAPQAASATRLPTVAALGRLEPSGDVRSLASPSGGTGVSPRVASLEVVEGEAVRRGQLLATFDSRPGLLAQRNLLAARIASLANQVRILEAQTSRYRRLTQAGATAPGDLDDREIQLVSRRLQLSEARAELTKLDTELVQSELRSPIDGLVLRIHTQPGERPGSSGILELGANQNMEAVAEVYESDIAQVRIGQRVRIKSETGGFKGDLQGRVLRISPQVQQRKVLSSDPSADADARIVEVRLVLDPGQAQRVRSLEGLKIIALFEP